MDQDQRDYPRERKMFELSLQRPKNFFNLSAEEQWAIDKALGILDWEGKYLTNEDRKRIKAHYDVVVNYLEDNL